MFFFLFFPFLPSLGTRWFQSFGPCNSATVSVNLSLGLGVSVRSDSGSSSLHPTHRGQVQCNEPEPRKKASPLFNSLCYDVMLLWAYIIFWNNSSNGTGKNIYIYILHFFIIIIIVIFLPPFSASPTDDGTLIICLYRLCPGPALPAPTHTHSHHGSQKVVIISPFQLNLVRFNNIDWVVTWVAHAE